MSADAYSLSPEMEDYLEAIAALQSDSGAARVTDIADRLAVRKPSVTQALRALAERGLLFYKPYQSPRLTQAGRQIAERVQRRHDLLKRFLTDVLLIEEKVAEANACRLEHAVDKDVLQHLTHFVDFIQQCPRGGGKWIRGYEHFCDPAVETEKCERCMELALEEYRETHLRSPHDGGESEIETATETKDDKGSEHMNLAQMNPGESGRILGVGNVGAMRRRLADMGAVKGTKVQVVKRAPLGDPIEVKLKGYSLTLRKQEAAAIDVEVCQ